MASAGGMPEQWKETTPTARATRGWRALGSRSRSRFQLCMTTFHRPWSHEDEAVASCVE